MRDNTYILMRTISNLFRWIYLRIIALVVLILPPLIFLVCAIRYFLSFQSMSTALHAPLKFSFTNRSGKFTVRAFPTHINVLARSIDFKSASLTGPDNRQWFLINNGTAVIKPSKIDLQAKYAEALVIRTKGGFNFKDLAEFQPSQEGKAMAISVRVDRLMAFYEDEDTTPHFHKKFNLVQLTFEGYRNTWLSKVTLLDSVKSQIQTIVKNSPEIGLNIELKPENFQIVPYLDYIKTWIAPKNRVQLETFKAQKITLNGPLFLHLIENKPIKVETDFTADIIDASLESYFKNANIKLIAKSAGTYAQVKTALIMPQHKLNFDGILDFGKVFRVEGNVSAFAENDQNTPKIIKKALPAHTHFNKADLEGWLSWSNVSSNFDGNLNIQELRNAKSLAKNISVSLNVHQNILHAILKKGIFDGMRPNGKVELDLERQAIKGYFEINGLDFKKLNLPQSKFQLVGNANVLALISGSFKQPETTIDIDGKASLLTKKGVSADLGLYRLRASLNSSKLNLDRFSMFSLSGISAAYGVYDLKTKKIDFRAALGNIPLSNINPEISGQLFANLHLEGEANNPQISGITNIYDLIYQKHKVPAILASIQKNKNLIEINNIQMPLSSGYIKGALNYNSKTQEVLGNFDAQQVQVSDWTEGLIEGLVSVQDIALSGTLKKPKVTAKLISNNLISKDILINNIEAPIVLNEKGIHIGIFQSYFDDSKIQGHFDYNYVSKLLTGEIQSEAVKLENIPIPNLSVQLEGKASFRSKFAIKNGSIQSLGAGVGFNDVIINKNKLGNGSLSINKSEDLWHGFGILGSLERTFQISEYKYNTKEKNMLVNAYFDNLAFQDIVKLSDPYLPEFSEPLHKVLSNLSGDIKGELLAKGNPENPEINIKNLALNNAKIYGRDAGIIKGSLVKKDDLIDIKELEWLGNDGHFQLQGTALINGKLNLKGSLDNLNLTWLNTLYPQTPRFIGNANSEFQIGGDFKNPDLIASFKLEDLGYWDKLTGANKFSLVMELNDITIKDGVLKIQGNSFYENIKAKITAKMPTNDITQLDALVEIDEQDINLLLQGIESMDYSKTRGKINANAKITHSGKKFDLNGRLTLSDARFGFNNSRSALEDVIVNIDWTDRNFQMIGQANNSLGGNINANIKGDLLSIIDSGIPINDILLDSQIVGKIELDKVVFDTNILSPTNTVKGTLDSSLYLRGNILQPHIKGNINLEELAVNFSPVPNKNQAKPFNPHLFSPILDNIQIKTIGPANIKSRVGFYALKVDADVNLNSVGTLSGTIASPELYLTSTIEKGKLNLPTAKIQFEQGGEAIFSYRSNPSHTPIASLLLNLEGTTQMTLSSNTDSFDRYDVKLSINGDLLQSDQLSIVATSDPGDRPSSELVEHLVHGGNLSRLANLGTPGSQGDWRLDSTLLGFAVPMLISPITDSLSQYLGLDYMSIDYDPMRGPIFALGKTIGKGFSIRFIKSINVFNSADIVLDRKEDSLSDISILYRLPIRAPLSGRATIGVLYNPYDQISKYKFNFEYSKKL